MLHLPNDPVMLLSFTNTQLRDNYDNLDDFCKSFNTDKNLLITKLENIDYKYDLQTNQFR